MNLGELFENGKIHTEGNAVQTISIEYIAHKSFNGVYLKHLVRGEQTKNQLSCHLVKVDPNCVLDEHVHPDHLEIHKVIAGNGTFQMAGKQAEYVAGTVGVIPENTTHKVTAGKDGVYILATFSPALL